jgi:hypothetical protein
MQRGDRVDTHREGNNTDLSQVFSLRAFRYALLLMIGVEGRGMIDFKGSQFEKAIILWGVRWYVAYPISYRQLEEMMGERGATVDHSSLRSCLVLGYFWGISQHLR